MKYSLYSYFYFLTYSYMMLFDLKCYMLILKVKVNLIGNTMLVNDVIGKHLVAPGVLYHVCNP